MIHLFKLYLGLFISIIDVLGILKNFFICFLNFDLLVFFLFQMERFQILLLMIVLIIFWRNKFLRRFCVQMISFHILFRRLSVSSIEFCESTFIRIIILGLLVFDVGKLTRIYPHIRHIWICQAVLIHRALFAGAFLLIFYGVW